MNIYQIISDSPYLSLFALYFILHTIFKCWNRFIRMLNIRKHGWPPPHCDADGDFPAVEDEEEENDLSN